VDRSKRNQTPSVFVIVPNKDGVAHLSYSMPSLLLSEYAVCNIVIVDDGSSDTSWEYVRKNFPSVDIVNNRNNKGFAGAVNTGVKHSLDHGADFIAICNNDVKVPANWVEPAIDIFRKYGDVGVVGYTEILKEKWGSCEKTESVGFEYREVECVPGCLFMCSSQIFQEVGLFDEDYYMYGEDNDFFSRVRRAGFVVVQTNIPIWHYGQGSSNNQMFRASWLAYRNALRSAIMNCGFGGVIRMLLSLVNQGCNVFVRHEGDPNWERLRQYGVFTNFFLIVCSCLWNVVHLPQTIKARRIRNHYTAKGWATVHDAMGK
jgi:GT2 family glycosyltransferase